MSMEPRHLGKYELRERLVRGGQGEVWKAFDPQLRRYVAIKLLHADMQSDPDFSSRFAREARFIASLHHSHIVQIHDFQLVHTPGSDISIASMVMDYVEGPTLADYIRNTSRKGQFPDAADIVYVFTAVSLALDYAHEKGMIHRDIKPANIILDQRPPKRNPIGKPILIDFGIAKLQGVTADTTKVLGTPLYVSPEQAQHHAVDKRSDLYSLGIILYEMTTGVTPFRGDSLMAILMQHFQELPTPPALINPIIPPALSEVILKSIAKEPDARFPSASANAGQTPLTAPADSRPECILFPNSGTNTPTGVIAEPFQVSPPAVLLQAAPHPPAGQRRSRYMILIALLVAVVAGSGLLYALFPPSRTTTPSPSNSAVGHVRFLSSPNARPGSLDEVEITIQHIPNAPPGERYYAWLQIKVESAFPIHWSLSTRNGGISSSKTDTRLLTNKPYLLLITSEKADYLVATWGPGVRLYYANLGDIQNQSTFDILRCPQDGTTGICTS